MFNVAVFSHSHPFYSKGGGEIVAFSSFDAMRASDVKAYFYSAINTALKPNVSIFSANEDIIEFNENEFLFPVRGMDSFLFCHEDRRFFPALVQKLKAQKINVFHFHHFWNVGADLICYLMSAFPSATFTLTLHELLGICLRDGQMVRTGDNSLCYRQTDIECHMCFPHIDKDQFRARRHFLLDFFQRFHVVTAPSEFVARRFLEWGLKREIVVIENGIARPSALAEKSDFEEESITKRFAFFGQPNPFKGIDIFLSAAAHCLAEEDSEIVFSIYGSDRKRFVDQFGEQWNAIIDRLGARLQFMGQYESNQVNSLMQQNGWVVLPSIWWENSPLVIQEAYIAGRPPIVADIGGMREKVQAGITGLHFNARNSVSLAGVIRNAAGNVSLWRTLRSNRLVPPTVEEMNAEFFKIYADRVNQQPRLPKQKGRDADLKDADNKQGELVIEFVTRSTKHLAEK